MDTVSSSFYLLGGHAYNRKQKEDFLSHVVQIQTQVRDLVAVQAACRRLNLPEPAQRTVKLFSETVTGLALQLNGWNFPVVCNTATGELKYDNFQGYWGAQSELDKFLQAYAVEKARIEARKQGHTVTEQQLQDGSIKLVVQIGGAS